MRGMRIDSRMSIESGTMPFGYCALRGLSSILFEAPTTGAELYLMENGLEDNLGKLAK